VRGQLPAGRSRQLVLRGDRRRTRRLAWHAEIAARRASVGQRDAAVAHRRHLTARPALAHRFGAANQRDEREQQKSHADAPEQASRRYRVIAQLHDRLASSREKWERPYLDRGSAGENFGTRWVYAVSRPTRFYKRARSTRFVCSSSRVSPQRR